MSSSVPLKSEAITKCGQDRYDKYLFKVNLAISFRTDVDNSVYEMSSSVPLKTDIIKEAIKKGIISIL